MTNDNQRKISTFLVKFAGASGSLLVVLGAMSGHLFKNVSLQQQNYFDIAQRYQFWHTAVLLYCALAQDFYKKKVFNVMTACFAFGILIFCGSLYAMSLGGSQKLGLLTPFGGTSFIIGWCCLALGLKPKGKSLLS